MSCSLSLGVLLWRIGDGEVRWQRLLQLLGLLGILQDKGVEMSLAADLELDLGGLLGALNAGRGSILASANLNEILDIGDLARHFGGNFASNLGN